MNEEDIKELVNYLLDEDYLGVVTVFLMNGCCGCPKYPDQCNSVPLNCVWMNMFYDHERKGTYEKQP